jgi:hypothetical protein
MSSYISKRTPKNIRGMIFAVIGVMACFGTILYLQLYNALLFLGAWMSFAGIALIDFVMLVFLLIMIFMGKFG